MQNAEGLKKAMDTIRKRYGVDPETGKSKMHMMVGGLGGKESGKYVGKGGFAKMNKERLLEVSSKGGSASRRGKAKKTLA